MNEAGIPRRSLRFRFMVAVMLWVAAGIGGIWFSATRLFAVHVEAQFHDELEVHIRELARLTRIDEGGQPRLTRPLSDPRYEVPLSGFYWQVTVPGKQPLRSASMTRGKLDESIAHEEQVLHEVEKGPTGPAITYGMVRPAAGGEDIHYVIATDKSELDRVISGFTRELTLWLTVLASALLATGIAVIGFALRPLDRLGVAVTRLRGGQAVRLEGNYPVEIAPLVEDLNAYIQQTHDMVSRARVQAGNLAHSLRTPLAVVTDEAERLAESGAAPQSADVLLEQARMMGQQIEYQLARARSAAGAHLPGATSTLPDLLLPIVAAMERLHSGKTFDLRNALPGPVTLPADKVDLSELLSILLDNAGKWARETVRIELSQADGRVRILITDDGPGMTEDQIAQAFAIGTRFDPDMPGSGLGLAIAKDLCATLGADLELRNGASGLEADLTI